MNIYCAGKIAKNDWRHRLAPVAEWQELPDKIGRTGWVYDVHESSHYTLEEWPVEPMFNFPGHFYTGPYFISCDHGCAHGENTHGLGGEDTFCFTPVYQADTFRLCMNAIARSDVVFAWIDERDAYGTFTELGYAYGLRKHIFIAGPELMADAWFVYRTAGDQRGRPKFMKADTPIQAIHHLVNRQAWRDA